MEISGICLALRREFEQALGGSDVVGMKFAIVPVVFDVGGAVENRLHFVRQALVRHMRYAEIVVAQIARQYREAATVQ